MMKKLIVLGILATMLMGMAVVAQAAATPWIVSVMATTDAAATLGACYGSFGIRTKGTDSFAGLTGAYDPTQSEINYTGGVGTALTRDYVAELGTANAGLPSATTTATWDFTAINVSAIGTLYVTAWNPSSVGAAIPSGLPYSITLYELTGAGGTIVPGSAYSFSTPTQAAANGLWTTGVGVSGSYAQYAIPAVPINGSVYFELVAGPAVPEPGSLVALFSGLVGLVGYGIRRRK
jgi:hypothetical protein